MHRILSLLKNLTIYGMGDVATSLISFLLLPVYVRYLSPADYGVIGLLLTLEVISKIVFRWGVDASFMRLYYDCPDTPARQRLASTIFFFLLSLNGAVLIAALAAAPTLARHVFGEPVQTGLLRLVLVNTFILGFYFLPFHVIRIQEQSKQFVGLTFLRSVSTLVLRLVLVVGFRMGVLGVVLADLVVNVAFTCLLARWFARLVRPVFSWTLLKEALRFGLPRLPHGIAHQVIATADRYWLAQFVPMADVGLYSIGSSFAMAMKLFLSAFEYAWAPFYFGLMREADSKRTFSLVTTYGIALLSLLEALLAATAVPAIHLMTRPAFYGAAAVVPWIGLGVLLQGVYLLTSIGLNVTKQTKYYPAATGAAAATSVALNLLLIPRFGALGAAWANAAAYGVLASVAMVLSHHYYPIPYEWDRLVKAAGAALVSWLVAILLPLGALPALALLTARGLVVVAVFQALLWVLGFYNPRELAIVGDLVARVRGSTRPGPVDEVAELAGEIVATPAMDDTVEQPEAALAGHPAAADAHGSDALPRARSTRQGSY